MPDHTPEPWRAGKTTDHEIVFRAEAIDGQPYLGKMLGEEAEANARRLVACVNFCQGTATEFLEGAGTLDRLLLTNPVKAEPTP